jgi:hypothetical protein
MDVGEIEWSGTDWFHVTEDRDWWRALVSTVVNLRAP